MAQLGQVFMVEDLPQGNNFEPIPSGWYTATITETELKQTKTGTGQYISVKFDIIAPTHQGRVVYDNINISNNSTKAEEIGRSQLGGLMRAVGLTRIADDNELRNRTCQIKVGMDKGGDGYEPRNRIVAYKASEGASLPQPSAPTAKPNASSTPPWKRA